MEHIEGWMRENTRELADALVEMNVEQFLSKSITGFGMRTKVIELLYELRAALFPTLYETSQTEERYLDICVTSRLNNAAMLLNGIVRDVLVKKCTVEEKSKMDCDQCVARADEITIRFMEKLPEVRRLLSTDIRAAYLGDPAAMLLEEILLSYPSIEAVSTYRLAHELVLLKVPLIPRIMTEYAHQVTGIDIHPGAAIGENFFIDHGTGVVIGETCVIGNNVKLYQGVTLGAKSFELDEHGNPVKGVKRHPNIEDNVVIYSGATILGGTTTVGHDSVIGGNVWLLESVPPYTKVYNSTPSPIINKL